MIPATVSAEPRIETIPEKKLVGMSLKMTFAENKTFELWRNFMPLRHSIKHRLNSDLISMQMYDPGADPARYDPNISFTKWASAEVSEFTEIPEGMSECVIPAGSYAVFIHRGAAETAAQTFGYIFGRWLPESGFILDQRPHFEVLGEAYKNHDPASEEEIWIPVKAAN